ncbi:MAG: CRAL-TRIO domain-containing protein [Benjaminiella poitrasii]|nr:MAG: CRAL-TRIO domain-containing protein [Benjaminiella poitrasii]
MLSIARENSVLFNDEYLKYEAEITTVQKRLYKDINLLDFDMIEREDAIDYINDRVTLFRFLKDSDFSEDKAVERLLDTIEWRKEQKIGRMTYHSVASEFFDNGFAFFHKQDLIGRPIAVVQMRHFPKFNDNRPLSHFMQPFACLVMEIARQLTRDLTRENEAKKDKDSFVVLISQITIIIDVAKAPFVPIDSSLMQILKDITNSRFPGFVGSVYIMNFGWMYQGIWQVVKLVLSEQAKARVNFVSAAEIKQIVDENDLPQILGGRDNYVWSLYSDEILNKYATEKRFETMFSSEPALLSPTRSRRSSSISSTSTLDSSLFFDASEYISRPRSRQHEVIHSAFTSTVPSVYGTPGSLTPINSYFYRHHQQQQQQQALTLRNNAESRYLFLNGFHMEDTFLTSFFRFNNNSHQYYPFDSQELTNRLTQLLEEEDLIDQDTFILMNRDQTTYFPHMLPDNHPQSIYAHAPVRHQLVRTEQRLIRLTRKLFHLSFAYKGALYWILLYLFLRGPVEETVKKTLMKLIAKNSTARQQIAYTTIGLTATVAAALSASFSDSLQQRFDNNKRHPQR